MNGIMKITSTFLQTLRREWPDEATLRDCGYAGIDPGEPALRDDRVLDRMQRMAGVVGAEAQLRGLDRNRVFDMAKTCARCDTRGTCNHNVMVAAETCRNSAEYRMLAGLGRHAD